MSLRERFEKITPYLPSKKFSKVLGICAAAIILLIIVTTIDFRRLGSALFATKTTDGRTVSEIIRLDSDQDGIQDWEESLWGTDPNNRDTDQDGIPDGTEIEERRRTLNQTALSSATPGDGSENEEELNETDRFAREFFMTVIALQQSGNLNDESMEALLGSFSSSIENFAQKKIYTQADMQTTDDTQESARIYLEAIDAAFTANSIKNDQAMNILAEALETDSQNKLDELVLVRANYENFRDDLLPMRVPPSAAATHLSLVNSLQGISENIAFMEDALENPIPAMASIHGYLKNLELLNRSLTNLSKYIESLI